MPRLEKLEHASYRQPSSIFLLGPRVNVFGHRSFVSWLRQKRWLLA